MYKDKQISGAINLTTWTWSLDDPGVQPKNRSLILINPDYKMIRNIEATQLGNTYLHNQS